MGRRIYKAGVDTVTVAATQDIWSLLASASNGIQLHWMQLTAGSVTTAAQLRLRLKRSNSTTVTQGTGGTTPAKNAVDDGDSKASVSTVHANDTSTQLVAGSLTGYLEYFQWNVLLPFDFMPGPEDEDRPACLTGEAFVLDFPGAVVSTVISQNAAWREYP